MAKLYYKIELRIAEWAEKELQDDCSINGFGDFFYYSDGYLISDCGKIEGYLTNDLIKGVLFENRISIQISSCYYNEMYQMVQEEFDFSEIREITGRPGEYFLLGKDDFEDFFAIICFLQVIEHDIKKENIEKSLTEIKKIHS